MFWRMIDMEKEKPPEAAEKGVLRLIGEEDSWKWEPTYFLSTSRSEEILHAKGTKTTQNLDGRQTKKTVKAGNRSGQNLWHTMFRIFAISWKQHPEEKAIDFSMKF
ncbi:hypothetical protein VIGAN_UM010400 [Vigna angularis var. angularis]|uniref:Uncharacterized protein n=1 Tax=Vigna angularis var. angularis TaxID=157739 RepID=A0A0S3TDG3_PHAAN|nr:hypothetical protein VIGAN_UM010400 [Vigna angularis var. angularis]